MNLFGLFSFHFLILPGIPQSWLLAFWPNNLLFEAAHLLHVWWLRYYLAARLVNCVARLKLLLVFFNGVACFNKRHSFVVFIDSSKTRAMVGTYPTVPFQLPFEIIIFVFKISYCLQQFLAILAVVASSVCVLATPHGLSLRSCTFLIVLYLCSLSYYTVWETERGNQNCRRDGPPAMLCEDEPIGTIRYLFMIGLGYAWNVRLTLTNLIVSLDTINVSLDCVTWHN